MTTGAGNVAGDLEAVTNRVRELCEQVIEQARTNGLAWLEAYERVLKNMLDLEEQAAKGTGAEWVTTLARRTPTSSGRRPRCSSKLYVSR